MEVLNFIIGAFVILTGFAIWHDIKENKNVTWRKILIGIVFVIIMLWAIFV